MTSSYTTNKKIEKPANGDFNNTWSTPVNNDWDIIDRAFGGQTLLNAVSVSGTVTLTATQYQAPIIVISGSITGNINYQLPSGVGGYWFIFNNTTTGAGGPYAIVFSSAGGGSTVTLAQGVTTAVICDGTNVGRADTNPPVAGGSNTQVQYNSSGLLAGSSSFVFDGTNVGIGTSSPSSLLQLNKASGAADLRFSVAGTLYGNVYASSSDMTAYSITSIPLILGTNNTERMRISASGNVGIGTSTPSAKLDVAGNILLSSSQPTITFNSGGGSIDNANAANTIAINTSGVERFRIGSSGQWGLSGANYGTSGQVLTSQGSGSPPIWTTPLTSPVNLATQVTGALPIANGGTNATTAAQAFANIAIAASTLASPGYIQLQNGLSIMWGTFTANANGSTSVTYASGVTLTSFSIAVCNGVGEFSATAQDNFVTVSSCTTSGFSAWNASNSCTAYYIAIGY